MTLTRLFNLSNGFYVALGHKAEADAALNNKLHATDAANKHATLHLVGKVFDLATDEETMKALIGGEELSSVSDDLALGAIAADESLAALALKVMDEQDISLLIPGQNRSAEASNAFAAHNAPVLAKLFAPKAP
jgi:hypothetical protein